MLNCVLLAVGKTNETYVQQGLDKYLKLLLKYCNFTIDIVSDVKNGGKLPEEKLKAEEAVLISARLKPQDIVILLDENGKQFNSEAFAFMLKQKISAISGRLVFVIGGAFGFDQSLKSRYESVTLSKMTFNHQMARIIFAEQLFRAFTIIQGTSYHH